ncbi:MAG: universal stress protein [Saprospiraceae bacterium]|nr:universal stress protein [Saprospiraceae bacterium]
MNTIKNIIVPTDFSVTARNAFHYARHLAEKLHATLTLVHVNEYFLPSQEVTVSPIADLEINQVSTEAMDAFIAEEEGDDDSVMVKSQVKTKILRGDTVNSLLELSNNPQTDLIVMGSTGTALFEDTLYIYYGAADERIACASVSLKALTAELVKNIQKQEK